MIVFHTDAFRIPLPDPHPFPIDKYRLLRERLEQGTFATGLRFRVADAATDGELRVVHDPDYVARVRGGTLDAAEVRRIGFPWSPEMVERSLRSCGSTVAAMRAVLDPVANEPIAVYLGGGTHHAFRDAGQGYCVFNDCAVAALLALRLPAVSRVLIVDCDVHQGNGTAVVLADRADAFTFSIHGAKNFPLRKEASDLDVALPDGTGDDVYLDALTSALDDCFTRVAPDLVFYLAGADPHEGDSLGRLGLTKAGLAARDRDVLARCARADVPVVVTMAGGYGKDVRDTVDVHAETVRQAAAHWATGREAAATRTAPRSLRAPSRDRPAS